MRYLVNQYVFLLLHYCAGIPVINQVVFVKDPPVCISSMFAVVLPDTLK